MRSKTTIRLFAAIAVLSLGACVSLPDGPSVMVLPGTGKNFDQFRADDFECKRYASVQIGGNGASAYASDSGVRSAAVGTLLGAAAGAAANGGRGAAVGAGAGMALGGLSGTGSAQASAYGAQQRYDVAFMQCMYAKGHRIPSSGRFTSEQMLMPRDTFPSYPPPPGRPAP
jgi:hypothetical protein